MWFTVSSKWLDKRKHRAFRPRRARRAAGGKDFRPFLESLESRWCPALMLTQAGIGEGLNLSTFATNFPASPWGVAFPSHGGVLVSDDTGAVRLFPNDSDGQDARNATVGQTYSQGDADDMAVAGGRVYLGLYNSGKLIQINDDGTYNHDVATFAGQPRVDGVAVNPATGHLLVALPSQDQIVDVDPAADAVVQFARFSSGSWPDGLTVSLDGSTLYAAAEEGGYVEGLSLATGAVVFGPVHVDGGPDGLVVGSGPLAGNLYVNCNNGTVVEMNLTTGNQVPVATGGTRGDFAKMDPADGSMLLTQSGEIDRLTFPAGPAVSFMVAALAKVRAGTPFDLTVTALDASGHIARGYTGTVTFATSDPDPGVVLPADYTFTAADGGVHTFTNTGLGETTLETRGYQTITATDTADGTVMGSATVKVRHARHVPLPGWTMSSRPATPGIVPVGIVQVPALSRSEPTRPETLAADRVFASLDPDTAAEFSLPRMMHAARADAAMWLPDLFGGENLRLL